MKKFIISGVFCSVLMLGGFQVASAEETITTSSTDNSAMLAKIQDLMKMIADLQAKLAEIRGEVQELTKDLALGAKDDDVRKIQEILASDPALFGVAPTGYFGPLTEAAIKKFQEKYGLPVTGVVDEATREVMKELRKERKDGHVPPGLVKSQEMHDKIKARLQAKWGDCLWGEKFRASDCQKGHGDKGDDGDEGEDEDDDNASSTDATRADAVAAIEEANDVIADFMDDIDQMEEDDVDQDEIDDAEDTLTDARKKLSEARRALVKGKFDDAVDKAGDAVEEITGDDDEDEDEGDDADDEDEDEDDESEEDDD